MTSTDRAHPLIGTFAFVARLINDLGHGKGPTWRAGRFAAAVSCGVVLVQLRFHLSVNEVISGACLGALYGLMAVGIILIYRTNRVINFAAAAIGAVPAIFALSLDVQRHVPYLVALPIALVGGPLFGGLVEVLIMRRFAQAPRLINMVVTIGVAQGFAAVGFFIPIWIGAEAGKVSVVPTPWDRVHLDNSRGQPVLTGNQIAALVVTVAISAALAMFLRRSRTGVALRAASENLERAALLGIPVKRIQTVAWMLAGFLASMAIYFQSPLIGVPSNATLGFDSLLYALGAAVIARMERIDVALVAGVFAGIIEFGVVSKTGKSGEVGIYMLSIILVILLLQRRARGRARDADISSWDVVKNFRPIPSELRSTAEVARGRVLLIAGVIGTVIGLPFVVPDTELSKLVLLPLYGMVGVSLVVLTGWGGQISLGQFGLVGVGAAASGGLVFNHDADFFVALSAGTGAGVAAAVLIGLPAVRMRGLQLAVTTLAFAYACNGYVLDKTTPIGRHLMPTGLVTTFSRPMLYGRINLENDRNFYFVCSLALLFAVLAAAAFRRNRSGRILIAARDNDQAAAAFGIDPVRVRLAAFAVSGGIAGMAGSLFAYGQHQVIPGTYGVLPSILVFLAAVIGGLTSIPCAVLGVVAVNTFMLFGSGLYSWAGDNVVAVMPLLITGPLLVLTLYQYPGGLAEVVFAGRDRFLRRVARRHDLRVPSLIADAPFEHEDISGEVVVEAGNRATCIDGSITYPVCGTRLAAADQLHLRNGADGNSGIIEPYLACRGVEVAYGKVQILFGVDIEIAEGEIVALLGTNGAGKSTLLKAISGVVRPTAGSIIFNGRDITSADAVATSRAGIVHVPGGKAVFPTLTVAEHFQAGAWLYQSLDAAEVQERMDAVLEQFPRLRERWHEEAGNLSGGEQQQLALGMAFVAKPRVLIIDELSLGLSPAVVEQLLGIVREIHALGCTIILVEQSVNVALTIATRAYFMEKGEVRFSGATEELVERSDILRSVFLQRALGSDREEIPRCTDASTPASDEQPALELRGLTKRFGGITAVDDVSIALHRGEILGLIGPNGAGKTTIFDILSGHLQPDRGTIHLGPRDVTDWSADRRAMLGLGRSFQDARIFPTLTVAENIAVALERHLDERNHVAALFDLPSAQQQEDDIAWTVGDLIELLSLAAFRDKFVSDLSTGTRRMVDLAMAIAHEPTVLLLDEPSSGIAQRETEALGPLIKRIQHETGCALLMIEHDMPLISSVADEIIALELGGVICRGAPDAVLSDPLVIASYLGGDSSTINRSGIGAAAVSGARPQRRRPLAANSTTTG